MNRRSPHPPRFKRPIAWPPPKAARRRKFNTTFSFVPSHLGDTHFAEPWEVHLADSQSTELSRFVALTDFLELHRSSQLFQHFSVRSSTSALVHCVNADLNKYRHICYCSDDPSPISSYVPMNCIYLSQFNKSTVPIVCDTGASMGLTPFRDDFVQFTAKKSKVTGIGSQPDVEGVGLVRWKIYDQHGKQHILECLANYVPSATVRLYSPQKAFQANGSGRLVMTHDELRLTPPDSTKELSFPINPLSNLPMMLEVCSGDSGAHTALSGDVDSCILSSSFLSQHGSSPTTAPIKPDPVGSSCIFSAITDEQNINLTRSQKELLAWHYRFGHVNMKRLQTFMHPSRALDSLREGSTEEEFVNKPCIVSTRHPCTHTCDLPKCAACILGKMERISSRNRTSVPHPGGYLRDEHLRPGDCISMDQFVVPVKGRTLTNSSRPSQQYSGGTIFVDHASGRVLLHNQISLRSGETLVGKRLLERKAQEVGITLRQFHADNGVFTSKEFRDDVERKSQSLSFSGVGAHHQNGVAERHIKTISYLACAMLLHAALQWPATHDLSLWAFCLDHAVYLWNHLPGDDGLSPMEKWTGSRSTTYDHLCRMHPWGCPSYVLDPSLQDGKRLPKWSPRSRQGKFVGLSKEHSTNVGLILNRRTKRISPQYHLMYDDFFTTVRSVEDTTDPVLSDFNWDDLISFCGVERPYSNNDVDLGHWLPEVDCEWLTDEELADRRRQPRQQREPPVLQPPLQREPDASPPAVVTDLTNTPSSEGASPLPPGHLAPPPRSSEGASSLSPGHFAPPPRSTPTPEPRRSDVVSEGDTPSSPAAPGQEPTPSPTSTPRTHVPFLHPLSPVSSTALPTMVPLRPRRNRRLPERLRGEEWILYTGPDHTLPAEGIPAFDARRPSGFYSYIAAESQLKSKVSTYQLNDTFLQSLDWNTSLSCLAGTASSDYAARFFTAIGHYQDPLDGTILDYHPLALSVKAADADNPKWYDATRGANADGFWKAMVSEVGTLADIDAFEVVPRTSNMHVISSTWAFKIKRFPSGLVRKLKAQLCVRGDQQIEGVDFFETFAPVVSWTTVQLLLILSIILDLKSTQVDYTAAFCQAPINSEVFISQPRGWQQLNRLGSKLEFKPNHVLKLNRSVYGLRQSPKNFFEHLKGNLLKCGFKQSPNDPCLFLTASVICLVYVDDCLFFSPSQSEINSAIERIKRTGMDLNVEDDVAGFLGVLLTRNEDGTISLTQAGLIQRIISALGLEDANPKKTPAPSAALGQDLNGPRFLDEYNYASVVGMLMYLAANSRPDIAFAVHQCARHTHDPSHLHGTYLKHIGRYLKGTCDKGLVLNPTFKDSLHLDCYVDADWAGLWNAEDDQDPHCVKSRTGYVINLAGCPILWKSKLQSLIAVSTMESEYIALSTACKELVPMIDLINEVATACELPILKDIKLNTTIWEDNSACLKLANKKLPQMSPRSKHIAIHYHWFRQYVGKLFLVEAISTSVQLADIFTKGLDSTTFIRLRERLCGW